MLKYSIIIPCYNCESYIENLIKEFDKIDRNDCEFIFVDDCSTDSTYQKVKSIIQEKNNFFIYQNKSNGGPGLSRNLGMEKSTGSYILFCDSDDAIDLSILSKFDEALKINPDLDLIISPLKINRYGRIKIINLYNDYLDNQFVPSYIVVADNAYPVAKLYKKEIIINNNILFPGRMLGEDRCFVVNYCVYAKKIIKIDFPYYTYIMRSNSLTHDPKKEYYQDLTTYEVLYPLYKQHFSQIIEQAFADTYLLSMAKRFFALKTKNKEVKQWFKEKNKMFPNWINNVNYKNQSIYRKLIYKAMFKNKPLMMKLILYIRKKIY